MQNLLLKESLQHTDNLLKSGTIDRDICLGVMPQITTDNYINLDYRIVDYAKHGLETGLLNQVLK